MNNCWHPVVYKGLSMKEEQDTIFNNDITNDVTESRNTTYMVIFCALLILFLYVALSMT